MGLWLMGHDRAKVYKQIGNGRVGVDIDGRLFTVWRSEIVDWCDDEFYSALDVWWRWRTLGGLPFAGGWAEQPAHLVAVIETLEAMHKSHTAAESRKQARRK